MEAQGKTTTDKYAGTTYRHLTDAAEAIELAMFYDSRVGFDDTNAALALEQIDAAIRDLQAARDQLV